MKEDGRTWPRHSVVRFHGWSNENNKIKKYRTEIRSRFFIIIIYLVRMERTVFISDETSFPRVEWVRRR